MSSVSTPFTVVQSFSPFILSALTLNRSRQHIIGRFVAQPVIQIWDFKTGNLLQGGTQRELM